MSGQGADQVLVYLGALLVLAYPLGLWMARVYGTYRPPALLGAAERGFYRLVRTDPREEQDWRGYGLTVISSSVRSARACSTRSCDCRGISRRIPTG